MDRRKSTISTRQWLDQIRGATQPKLVLVSSLREYLNLLIRSCELTKGAFETVGSTVYATWLHGNISVVSDGKTLKVSTARQP
jgi:hypothetical protein